MKKLAAFILTIFTVATLFAAALPSLDGRAVVAEAGTMPRGLFARTVGYLPGDSVTVTNPESGISTEILVLGAIDPSEGVAILLSPEAAEALKISPGSNVQVKLTKRSGSIDENASGSAVLSNALPTEDAEKENAAADENAETAASESESGTLADESEPLPSEPVNEEAVAADALASTEETASEAPAEELAKETAETAVEETPASLVDETAPETAVEETPASLVDESAPEMPAEETAPEAPAEELAQETIETPVEETPASLVDETAPEAAETAVEETPASLVDESAPEMPVEENSQPVEVVETAPEPEKEEKAEMLPVHEEELPSLSESKEDAEPLQPVAIVEEAPAPVESEPLEEKTEVAEEMLPALDETAAPSEEKAELADEKAPALEKTAEEPPAAEAEKEPEVVAEAVADETAEDTASAAADDAFQPIVLVPAEMNPPEKTASKADEAKSEKASAPSKDLTASAAPYKDEDAPKTAVESAKPAVSNDWRNYIVPSHKNLVKGRYYIQIASLSKESNIKALIDKYSSKYPMVLIESTSGKSYQVMLGPLSIDEYGSVLEKMKAYGYKDAFVKKIN